MSAAEGTELESAGPGQRPKDPPAPLVDPGHPGTSGQQELLGVHAKAPVAVVADFRRRTSSVNAHGAGSGEGDGEPALHLAAAKNKFGVDAARLNCLQRGFGAVRRSSRPGQAPC
jgi:hypothetical protein